MDKNGNKKKNKRKCEMMEDKIIRDEDEEKLKRKGWKRRSGMEATMEPKTEEKKEGGRGKEENKYKRQRRRKDKNENKNDTGGIAK